MMRIALTCDDAPWSTSLAGAPYRDGVMDRMRELLEARGVRHCVAFVISEAAEPHVDQLERWLNAGYELGNHTHDHRIASECTVDEFMQGVERCDQLLTSLGAFKADRPRWFRFPQLDRGRDPEQRRAVRERFVALGYRVAHASTDLYDHHFEGRYLAALDVGNSVRAREVAQRYRRVARESLRVRHLTMSRTHGAGFINVPYFHFGAVSLQTLGPILDDLPSEVEWCSLDDAMDQPAYRTFDEDFDAIGLVTSPLHMGLPLRIGRRLGRMSNEAGLLRQADLGPRFPYL